MGVDVNAEASPTLRSAASTAMSLVQTLSGARATATSRLIPGLDLKMPETTDFNVNLRIGKYGGAAVLENGLDYPFYCVCDERSAACETGDRKCFDPATCGPTTPECTCLALLPDLSLVSDGLIEPCCKAEGMGDDLEKCRQSMVGTTHLTNEQKQEQADAAATAAAANSTNAEAALGGGEVEEGKGGGDATETSSTTSSTTTTTAGSWWR